MSHGRAWDVAATLDGLVTWMETRWRAVVYSFLAGILFTMLMANCSAAHAASYAKPAGVPEIFLPEYQKTIAVFAITSPAGSGLAVLERQPDGNYVACGICTRFVVDLAGEIAFKGGARQYIEAMVPDVNDIMVYNYPMKTAPVPGATPVGQLNYSLFADGFTLRMVNGVPVLGSK